MGVAARSRERVERRLADLEGAYGSFPITQTTISLPGPRYVRAREQHQDGLVDVYAEVHNDEGEVLHVERDTGLALPGTATDVEDSLEQGLRRAVERETGIECDIDGLTGVTIAGIRNEDDPDGVTVYRLVVVFSAVHESGVANGSAAWATEVRDVQPVVS
jgi:ADP-ribose pyrophosphatase YjhB (NUDIX family)